MICLASNKVNQLVRKKYKFQVVQDAIMLVLLLSLMGYHLWGEEIHELLGVTFCIMTVLHNTLNFYWFKNLKIGGYTAFRILQLMVNALLMLLLIGAILSGLMLSQYVLPNLIIHNSSDWVRTFHMTSVHWLQIAVALHLGTHWKMLANFFCKIWSIPSGSFLSERLMPTIFIVISIYGSYVFIQRDIFSYLFLMVDFSFFDFDEFKVKFYLDFFAVVILFAYLTRFLLWLFWFRFMK